jgi:hypothetical protein
LLVALTLTALAKGISEAANPARFGARQVILA